MVDLFSPPWTVRPSLPTWLSKMWKVRRACWYASTRTQKVADLIAKVNVPTVNLRSTLEGLPFPYVGPDNAALARLAVQHLLDRGIKHFALCSRSRGKNPAIDERSDSFMQLIWRRRAIPATSFPLQVVRFSGTRNNST